MSGRSTTTTLDRNSVAKTLLIADGIGCLVAMGTVMAVKRPMDEIDRTGAARRPVAVALGVTGALLLAGGRRAKVRNRDLGTAATINSAWVIACLYGMQKNPSELGTALLAATAVADASAGIGQFLCREAPLRR